MERTEGGCDRWLVGGVLVSTACPWGWGIYAGDALDGDARAGLLARLTHTETQRLIASFSRLREYILLVSLLYLFLGLMTVLTSHRTTLGLELEGSWPTSRATTIHGRPPCP